MPLPRINIHDGRHKMIVAEDGERVLTPEQNKEYEMQHPGARQEPMKAEVYDKGGTVEDRISARAKELYDQSKAVSAPLVGASGDALQQQGQMLRTDMGTPSPDAAMKSYAPVAADRVNPEARYGMHSKEQRLDDQGNVVDPTTPQGMGAAGPKMPVPSALYDKGGVVGRLKKMFSGSEEDKALDEKQKNIDEYNAAVEAEKAGSEKKEPDPDRPEDVTTPEGMGAKGPKLPEPKELSIYDEGGDVSTEDEAAKAAARKQAEEEVKNESKGAPSDFGGMVIPNPKGIKPQMDTDKPEPDLGYKMQGAKMLTDNAPTDEPTIKDPQVPLRDTGEGQASPVMTEASTRPRTIAAPRPTGMNVRPSLQDNVPKTTPSTIDENQVSPSGVNPEHAAIIQKDKEDAASKGDLLGLGKAMINERIFAPKKEEKSDVGPILSGGSPEMPQYTGTQKAMNAEKHSELQAKRQDYDKRIQAALDTGTPQGQAEAASLQLAKSHFDKMNPFGSEANHPGLIGKIEHGLAKAGNIAGNIVAPGTMSLIPGTELNKQEQRTRAEGEVAQGEENRLKEAQASEAEGKPALQQEQQRITEEKNQMTHEAALRQKGYKTDAAGNEVPLQYAEMSAHEQGVYDLNAAKSNAQNAIAELKQAQADPNSPQSKLILEKAKSEAKKLDIAGQKLGLDTDRYKAEFLGVDREGKPLPGAQTTTEGKAVGTKVAAAESKATAMQKNKADLSENVQHNVDEATKLIKNNTGLFGKVQGRFTNVAQMAGSDDPAIAQLGVVIHNIAVASAGIHGQRGQSAVEAYEKDLLNKFHNSPEATLAAMDEIRNSVGDFMKDANKKEVPKPTAMPKGIPETATHTYKDKDGKIVGYADGGKYHSLESK